MPLRRPKGHTVTIFLLIALGLLLLILTLGALSTVSSGGPLGATWVRGLTAVIVTIIVTLAILTLAPSVEAVMS